ncbi:MAG: exopolysaccharide biosynthesis polyprenyl glycosylphosphotransferase, partial [Verrucomicrobia bacterium]|nr:exopolysaccharide biosynthesis polyprenyl glycosylphosphotransferase [Verrucomicrobiota bacterium]
ECRQFPHRIAFFCFLGDAFISFSCLLAAFWLRFDTPLRDFGVREPAMALTRYSHYIILGWVALLVVLAQKQMYESSYLLRRRSSFKQIFAACLVWGAGFLGVSLFFKFQPPLSRGYGTFATLTTMIGLYTWRRLFYSYLCRESIIAKRRQRILVVGWTTYAQRLKDLIAHDPSHPYELVCCVPTPAGNFQQEPSQDVQRFDSYAEIRHLLNTLALDIVLVADINLHVKQWEELASLCEKELIQFKLVPSYFSILVSGLCLESISGIPILGISNLPLDRMFNKVVKRLVDIVGAIAGLVLSAPLVAIFGALVYLESPGPILYRQRRLGRNGKTFDMLKIRSMRLDAEKNGKVGWSIKDDPRRLRIGASMRKWNIDETPQFWNVLKGDMSLVGPRPERPELIQNFKHEIPHYNARHTVKPGITGWSQVNGLRGDTDLAERINYDLYYVEHWNLLFDFRTMLLTFFRNRNAH